MKPLQFKQRYIASLPKVPEELRDELGLERFVLMSPEVASSLEIPADDAAILTEVGLPMQASPFMNFDFGYGGHLASHSPHAASLAHMTVIGSNANGDDICLDANDGFSVVCLDHDGGMKRTLINSSISLLAECLCLYLTHRHLRQPKDLVAAIEAIDPRGAAPDSFWHFEATALAARDGGA